MQSVLLRGKIILIRPKLYLANDGNYREERYFTGWDFRKIGSPLEDHIVPESVSALTGQSVVPFGIGIVETVDSTIAAETCEELFTPNAVHIALSLDGVEIFSNGSGSHHQLRKLDQRLDLIRSATAKGGGIYLYSNQRGCDGGRLYYDGSALVVMNGRVYDQAKQFDVSDVQVITSTVDLEEVRSYRASVSSRSGQASVSTAIPRVHVDYHIAGSRSYPTTPRSPKLLTPEEEIAYGPACWLWDYLRRSGASGFFLPLSGGADSASVAAIVGVMCNLVCEAVKGGNERVAEDVQRLAGQGCDDPAQLASSIFHTCYMGTENSTNETRHRAEMLAAEIGSYHTNVTIDGITDAIVAAFAKSTGKTPQFTANGGTYAQDLALQNIQARSRMVFGYMQAQLLPWVRSRKDFCSCCRAAT